MWQNSEQHKMVGVLNSRMLYHSINQLNYIIETNHVYDRVNMADSERKHILKLSNSFVFSPTFKIWQFCLFLLVVVSGLAISYAFCSFCSILCSLVLEISYILLHFVNFGLKVSYSFLYFCVLCSFDLESVIFCCGFVIFCVIVLESVVFCCGFVVFCVLYFGNQLYSVFECGVICALHIKRHLYLSLFWCSGCTFFKQSVILRFAFVVFCHLQFGSQSHVQWDCLFFVLCLAVSYILRYCWCSVYLVWAVDYFLLFLELFLPCLLVICYIML